MSGITARDVSPAAIDRRWAEVDEEISDVGYRYEGGRAWWLLLLLALGLVGLLVYCLFWVLYEGVGVWGNNIPVTWALDIVAYDWWIGVATGGLFVSAFLLLLGAEWRGAVSRLTETMALLAAAAAGLYPIIHLGRPWFFYWNLPYPNTFLLWPQFRSPLYWDAVDIISFLVVCLTLWYVGMLPDLAAMRDRGIERVQANSGRTGNWLRLLKAQLYGIAALGWRGSMVHWQRWEQACQALALFAVIVVISLQTGAAVMFAGTLEPGWHDTLLPVAFLFAALFAGVGLISAGVVVLRTAFPLRDLVTSRHISLLAMLLLGLGVANLYCYAAEFLTTLLAGTDYDKTVLARRFHGPHAWSTWLILAAALLPVHLFWVPPLRRSAALLLIVGVLVALGMWADHFMIIVITLQQDFLPSSFHLYAVNLLGIGTFFGSTGLFLLLLLLAVRYLPMVSILGARRMIAPGMARSG